MNKKSKLVTIIAIFMLLVLNISVFAYATEEGKINFVAVESTTKESISNLTVNIYKIGVKNENEDFEYSEGFEGSNLDVNTFTESNINTIKEYALKNAKPVYSQTTDAKGTFTISNLQVGAYLLVQSSNTDKYTMQTMLVQIPEVNGNSEFNYNVTVKPKVVNNPVIPTPGQPAPEKVTDNVLPYTGVLSWPIPVLVIVGIVIFSIGWLKVYTDSKKKVK